MGTYPTTLYRLIVPPTLDGLTSALNQPYLRDSGFRLLRRDVAGTPALLVNGTVDRERAEWCDVLAGLTGAEVALGHRSGGGALLVAVDDRAYALAYGTLGRFMVERDAIDPGFGIAFAVRALLPDDIRQVRRRFMGTGGRVDRSLVPGGQHIRMYGIDRTGEIVGQVTGRTNNPALTVCRRTGRATRVSGGDALHVELSVEPEGLLADLREIDRVCRLESPAPDLEFITQIRPVPAGDPRLPALIAELDARLGLPDPPDVGLAVPGELLDEVERVRAYRIRVPKSGRRPTLPTELDLASVLAHTRGVPAGERWTSLRAGRITLCGDAAGTEELDSRPAARWVTAQLAHGTDQLLLHEDRWYEIGHRHREFLRDEIAQILARPASVALPAWRDDENEEQYNERAARERGLVLLDKRLLRTAQHPRGIEACDLLGPDDELIHVKRAGRSSPLSHLFAQGTVAADALRHDGNARAALARMARGSGRRRRIGSDFRPRKVVYAISLGSGAALTVDSLFTFAQVALYRAMKSLRNEGVDVEVVGLPTA
ncbi:sporadically distributed protein, TIGR04141 family [Micromonospora haikouensis]|uniref:Sporadically distributed protein, TIGR04141 family n=1 Tax=Micromonospora haikouensis TaxID=686309 RepID=A0A1C4XK11_9ACTN|nr:DUF6119 family protein [Micromonospora haikouensis]SCF08828.1 sporadically distributed protein, TIGR04141 family [Micromonospora haikouensis]